MRTQLKFGIIMAAIVALAFAGYAWTRRGQSQEPPLELVTAPSWMGTGRKVKATDNHRVFLDVDTLNQELTVRRQFRGNSSAPWINSNHTETASFYLVDASAGCEAEVVYVTGVYPDGSSAIEKWTYNYPPVMISHSGVATQGAPKVRRRVLYQGYDYGHIRTLEVDPEQRYLLFLTLESTSLMRMELPAGPISAVVTPASVPLVAQSKTIAIRQFSTIGRAITLLGDDRRSDAMDYSYTTLAIVPDSNNDGQFEAPYTMSIDAWNAAEMDRSPPNVPVCP
jgi:hypothetical protein